jgi:cold-inducible RNA-binding protein
MSSKLYVGNVPFQITESELSQLFEACGTVEKVSIATDRETGRPRGFAFIEMDTPEAAEQAIADLDGAELGGRNIKVSAATERDASAPRRPFAKDIGTGDCIFCGTKATLYGFENSENGVCANCIFSLSKASRPPRDDSRPRQQGGRRNSW